MSIGPDQGLHGVGLEELKRGWGWFLGLGITLVILGGVALAWSVLATIISVQIFGWMLLFSGGLGLVHAFMRRRWSGFFIDLFAGALSAVVGLMLAAHPAEGAAVFTLLIALFLMIGGLFRIIAALSVRYHNWVWLLLNGVVTLLLGFLIWKEWPWSGLWVIGTFVGIDMMLYGWSLVMLGLSAKGIPDPPPAASQQ